MKIIFLSRLYNPHIGGVEKHVKKISEILSKKYKITIITEQFDPKLPEYENYFEAEVYRIPVYGIKERDKKWTIWRWFIKHRKLIKDADIIHAHDVFFWVLPLRFIYVKKKYYVTYHGYEGSKPPNLKQIFWHKIGEWLTQGNICIGNFIPKWYKTKATLISYGAVEGEYRKIRRTGKVIYFGRLANDTGILDYIDAAGKLGINIDIYGDGPLKNEVTELFRKSKIKCKIFGFIPDVDRLLPSYRMAFVSRYLGILEALFYRIPVIAHYDSPIKYDYLSLTPFSGFIKICGNSREIENAFKDICSNQKDTNQIIQSGYNWAVNQTWEKLAGQYQTLWLTKAHLSPQQL